MSARRLCSRSGVALIGAGPAAPVIIVCIVGAGIGWAFVYIESITLAQRLAGDDVMSRVFGVMEALMMTSQSLGALAVPVLIVTVGPAAAIVACGVVLALVTLLAGPVLIRADRLMPERIELLSAMRGVPMFSPLSAPVLERLASSASRIAVASGAPIVSEGEVGDRFYVILHGSVRVSAAGRALGSLGVGESFGEIALLHDVPRTATVTAVEPVELLAVDRSRFLEA